MATNGSQNKGSQKAQSRVSRVLAGAQESGEKRRDRIHLMHLTLRWVRPWIGWDWQTARAASSSGVRLWASQMHRACMALSVALVARAFWPWRLLLISSRS